jgi:hypothetical protein
MIPRAIAPGDPGGACEMWIDLPTRTEMEGWFRGMIALFRMP